MKKKEENIKSINANKEEFMTVGQIAKKMNVTVRTLQFYDKKDILKPSAESEGGRRLYTSKDVVKLDQIIALKQLGFSLEDIKGRLPNLDSPEEVVEVLRSQSEGIRQQVNTLMEVLVQIEKLSAEITQMHVVDWSTYADILNLIREDNMNYKYLRFYSNKMKNYMRELDQEKAQYITEHNAITNKTATEYWKQGVDYKSKKAQKLAKENWDLLVLFADGDDKVMEEMLKTVSEQIIPSLDSEQQEFMAYMSKLMMYFFEENGIKLPGEWSES